MLSGPSLDRRTLLSGSLGLVAALATGCSLGRTSGTSGGAAPPAPSSPPATPAPAPSETRSA
nr:hypothetical protein [Actinomycetota bacterium]